MNSLEDRLRKRIQEWKEREISAVLNNSPAIYLTKTGALDFLRVYGEVFIPPKVKEEVVSKGIKIHAPDAYILQRAVKRGDIKVREIGKKELYSTLIKNPLIHEADAEAVVLAEELNAVLVMDDPRGIEVAELRNIKVEPTLTVLLIGYALGIADFERTQRTIRNLLTTKFRVPAKEYEKVMEYLHIIKKLQEDLRE
jgi:predicted nucleic acid-binding protein